MVKKYTCLLVVQSNNPTNHIRIVSAGMSWSSIFDTDARTSGYGESSSSIVSKSNSILDAQKEAMISKRNSFVSEKAASNKYNHDTAQGLHEK